MGSEDYWERLQRQRAERQSQPRDWSRRPIAATHRVETSGLPPLFAVREADALSAAAGRGATSAIYTRAPGTADWGFWRSYP